jgi:hypothetical protein
MRNIHAVSSQVFAYLRVTAFAILMVIIIFATVKGTASGFAPHAPDIALDVKLDSHRKSVENSNNQKASDKVDAYKNHKEQKKAEQKAKRTDPKKANVTKPKSSKPKKSKPPKPSKADKKKAAKHRVRTLA